MEQNEIPDLPNYSNEEPQTTSSMLKNHLLDLIQFMAILGAFFIIIRFFVAEPHKVSGTSMTNNFHDGDYLITNKLATISGLKRGEVIILENPKNRQEVFIKRIIGLPNEKIKIQNSRIYINNQLLEEPYLPSNTITEGGMFLMEGEEIIIPDNQYFVLGDNRGNSSDSREWGPIDKSLIIGQAWFRYWPFDKIGLIHINQPSF